MSPKPTSEGTIPFLVPAAGKEVVTYYKIFGDIKEPGKVPCVLLHGGPGLSHDYMLSCVPLYTQFGIPLILYDQIGNGLSTHLPEKKGDEEFFTEELFHHELSNLISHLKLDSTGYDILGHSWGGMMGSTFAGKQPKGLKRLVISNSSASIKSWIEANNEYRRRLPQEMQDTLQKHEDAGTTESKEYEGVMDEFYRRHMCYVTPPPAEFARTLEWIGKDSTVAMTMTGPSEFEVTGSQRNWSAVEAAKNINVPTLVINGQDELATDEGIKPYLEGIKDVKWVKLGKSSHMAMYEEPERYFEVISEFLLGT